MGAGYDLFESEASVFEPVHRRIRSGRLLKPLASFLLLGVIYASMMKMVCRSEMARGKRKKAANLDMRQWSGCNSVDEPMGNATLDSLFWRPPPAGTDSDSEEGTRVETEQEKEVLPKISHEEATSFHDLLSRIFIYNPTQRISAAELSRHPWFTGDFSVMKEKEEGKQ